MAAAGRDAHGMDPSRLARLTERERTFLRLVASNMSSKEIAQQFGIEPGTVDKALKSAMAKLGTSSRRTAARMLTEAEGGQKLAPQPAGLDHDWDEDIIRGSNADRDWVPHSASSGAVREEQVAYRVLAPSWNGIGLPFPRYEGDRNDLTIGQRLAWIGLAALGIIVAVGTLITISAGVSNTISSIVNALS